MNISAYFAWKISISTKSLSMVPLDKFFDGGFDRTDTDVFFRCERVIRSESSCLVLFQSSFNSDVKVV